MHCSFGYPVSAAAHRHRSCIPLSSIALHSHATFLVSLEQCQTSVTSNTTATAMLPEEQTVPPLGVVSTKCLAPAPTNVGENVMVLLNVALLIIIMQTKIWLNATNK